MGQKLNDIPATPPMSAADGSTANPYFRLARDGARWQLIQPDGQPLFLLGLNHVDPAPLLDQPAWRKRYGNDMRTWLTERVRPDLLEWGFNCLGLNQEISVANAHHHRGTRSFTLEEYRWLGMPFGHMLPFSEMHQWECETRLPDIRHPDFAEWCDAVAREHCLRMRDEPLCIGYYFCDCPTWIHTRAENAWRGTLFPADRLATAAGRQELRELATIYYRTIHDAIRRYDPYHLILGDRYEAVLAPLPEEVLEAATPFVDVFCFQCFAPAEVIRDKLAGYGQRWDKPVLLVDWAQWRQPYTPGWPPKEDRVHDTAAYRQTLEYLRQIPQCIGAHLCGAYLLNRARRYGLRLPDESLSPATDEIRRINLEIAGPVS